MFWALTDSMARNPDPWIGDALLPNLQTGMAYRVFATIAYPRVKEIIENDLGSALIYLNSHAVDLKTPEIPPLLDRYVREQCLGEYDLDGWTAPDLVNPTDVNRFMRG
jgi:4-hydroxyphenylacetate 3-monooxygenase